MEFEELKLRLDHVTEMSMRKCRDVLRMRELMENISWLGKFKEKHGITKVKNGCIGFSDKEQKWYGWSHRVIIGFGVGDRIFEVDYGDEKTLFVKHGSRPIKNMADAEESAMTFARYVS